MLDRMNLSFKWFLIGLGILGGLGGLISLTKFIPENWVNNAWWLGLILLGIGAVAFLSYLWGSYYPRRRRK